MKRVVTRIVLALFLGMATRVDAIAQTFEHGTIDSLVTPFVEEHCIRCHGAITSKGDLRLDVIERDMSRPATFERWQGIVERVRTGEMPPKDEPQPKPGQVADFVKQVTAHLDAVAAVRRAEGRVVLRRLNRVEYENTVRELFDVDVSVKEMLPEDAIAHGFDNVGAALNMSPVLI